MLAYAQSFVVIFLFSTYRVWNTATGTLKRTIEAHTASVLAIQYE